MISSTMSPCFDYVGEIARDGLGELSFVMNDLLISLSRYLEASSIASSYILWSARRCLLDCISEYTDRQATEIDAAQIKPYNILLSAIFAALYISDVV